MSKVTGQQVAEPDLTPGPVARPRSFTTTRRAPLAKKTPKTHRDGRQGFMSSHRRQKAKAS